MRVQVKDLVPNPFRDIDRYPFDEEKVKRLIDSINLTGFWENILARAVDDKKEIAYGHHRLVALKRILKPTDFVEIPVKDLDDATMIQIMANENDERWHSNVKVIDETVRVTKEFLESHPEEVKNMGFRSPTDERIGARVIGQFLGWPERRVSYSLERLGLIEKGELDKEAVESMPTDRSARGFTLAVKSVKGLTPEQQKEAARKIKEREAYGEKDIERTVLDVKYGKPKEDRLKTFEEFLEKVAEKIHALRRDIDEILRYKEEFDSEVYDQTLEKKKFLVALGLLDRQIEKFKGGSSESKTASPKTILGE
jgi:ParB-like chromosome segregation protein Spo0J